MRLSWDRPEIVRVELHVTELATLIAGARLAAAALAANSAEQAAALERVLAAFDRAAGHLGAVPRPAGGDAGYVATSADHR